MSFGNKLRQARKEKRFTQKDIANAIGVTPNTVYRWESGDNTPGVDVISKLAEVLGVSLSYLVDGSTAPTTKELNSRDKDFILVPVLSPEQTACCGSGIAEMDITSIADSFVPLQRSKIGTYDPLCPPYAIQTEGESMEGFGIHQGATVYINPREEISSLDVCLVCYYGRLAIKKVLIKKDGGFELLSSDGEKIIITHDEFENGVFDIRGKVIGSFNIPSHGRF